MGLGSKLRTMVRDKVRNKNMVRDRVGDMARV